MDAPPSPLPPLPRPLSPNSVSRCALLDLSITAEPRPHDPRPRPHDPRPRPQSSSRGKAPPLDQQQPNIGQRNVRLRGNSSAIGRVQPQPEVSNQLTACPEGAELNTTLALKGELQSLQEAQWDAAKTLKETLEKNKRTQTLINSRATHGVSFPRRAQLYSSLVSVHVSEVHVIRRAALQRLPLAAAPKAPPISSEGPSLLPLTFDLCHTPLPLQPGPAPSVKPRPHSATFILFQRQQRWASTQ